MTERELLPEQGPTFPPYIAHLLDRAATLLQACFPATDPVHFTWWADGEECGYVGRWEWDRSVTAPQVTVMRASTGYPVCRSLPGRVFEVDPATVNLDTAGEDEIARLVWESDRAGSRSVRASRSSRAGAAASAPAREKGTAPRLGPEIRRRRPEPADETPWRNTEGETLGEALGKFIRIHAPSKLPDLEADASRIEVGDLAGFYWHGGDGNGQGARYFLTLATMAAFVAEQGIAAITPAELHHVLAELVEGGHLASRVKVHAVPGLGDVWCYSVAADLAELR